jgi:EAL domain-containing protein (putative c-di-GMP-specific phosphodiesterase class I)
MDFLNVNLSAAEFFPQQLRRFPWTLSAPVARTPAFMCLEVTETAATVHRDVLSASCATWEARSCRFALDDFGTGYANLTQAVALPLRSDPSWTGPLLLVDNGRSSSRVFEDLVAMFSRIGIRTVCGRW